MEALEYKGTLLRFLVTPRLLKKKKIIKKYLFKQLINKLLFVGYLTFL